MTDYENKFLVNCPRWQELNLKPVTFQILRNHRPEDYSGEIFVDPDELPTGVLIGIRFLRDYQSQHPPGISERVFLSQAHVDSIVVQVSPGPDQDVACRMELPLDSHHYTKDILSHQERVAARLQHYMTDASGSHIQKSAIALTMVEIEHDLVQKERAKLSPSQQFFFMMAYECLVMWAFKVGMDKLLQHQEVEAVIVAMRNYFVKHASYQPEVFEQIWAKTQIFMAVAGEGGAKLGAAWPITDMIEATNQAGCALDHQIGSNVAFGLHVISTIKHLEDVAGYASRQQKALDAHT